MHQEQYSSIITELKETFGEHVQLTTEMMAFIETKLSRTQEVTTTTNTIDHHRTFSHLASDLDVTTGSLIKKSRTTDGGLEHATLQEDLKDPQSPSQHSESTQSSHYLDHEISIANRGKGDHGIAHAAIVEVLRTIIEETKVEDIIGILNHYLTIFNVRQPLEETEDLKARFREAQDRRSFRKELTQRFRGIALTKSQFANSSIREYLENFSTYAGVKLDDRILNLVVFADEYSSLENLKKVKEQIYEGERVIFEHALYPLFEEFSKRMDTRELGKQPKKRIEQQRTQRIERVKTAIKKFDNLINIDPSWSTKKNGESTGAYYIRVLEKIKAIAADSASHPICNRIGYKKIDDIESDIHYYHRWKAEGTKVRVAMSGLRAFDRLIAISLEKSDQKETVIEDFLADPDNELGLAGTIINPTFGISLDRREEYLWNLTDKKNSTHLKTMCEKVGQLFERLLDFERKIVRSEEDQEMGQDAEDAIQLEDLVQLSAEMYVLMLLTFKSLQTFNKEYTNTIKLSFIKSITSNQGWSNIVSTMLPIDDVILRKFETKMIPYEKSIRAMQLSESKANNNAEKTNIDQPTTFSSRKNS